MDHENNNVPKPKLIVFDLGEYIFFLQISIYAVYKLLKEKKIHFCHKKHRKNSRLMLWHTYIMT